MQLLTFFTEQNYAIHFATHAGASEKAVVLTDYGIAVQNILLNDPSFDVFIAELNPTVVLFDRFITEEQFGWRVAAACPNALRILDTEDLHFLRKARQLAIKENLPIEDANLHTETAMREIASIFRCDLSLLISEVEKELLIDTFKVPEAILMYVPFMIEPSISKEKEQLPRFSERTDFITIGNLLHAPNVDAVLQLKQVIWPQIRKKLPQANLRIFGAYAPQQIKELHNENEGFIIAGWAVDAMQVLAEARVSLAPLRFGAGFLAISRLSTSAIEPDIS